MKLFIACPSHYGEVTCGFMTSYNNLRTAFAEDGIDHIIHFNYGDSAVGRARNNLAQDFLESGFDKLLFIDTDLIFKPEDVRRLLRSEKKIVGGTYPLKGFPITLNFNPLNEQRGELFPTSDFLTSYKDWAKKWSRDGEIEVKHVPTGLLLIDRSVFTDLAETTDWYYHHCSRTGLTRKVFDFFQFRVLDHEYLSEDWFFCHKARERGHKIYLQSRSITQHTGLHHFALGQHVIIGQQPLLP